MRRALGGALLLGALVTIVSSASAAVFNHPTQSSPIQISQDDKLVWVVNPRDNTVSVIRTDTNNLLATINVGKEPRSIAIDPNNEFAYVANAAASTVTVLRINDASVGSFSVSKEKTITTGAEPWNIAISPDGKIVYVANSAQDTISLINGQTRNLIGHFNIRNSLCNDPARNRHFQPRGLAITQNNTQLYVTRFLSFTRATGGRQAKDTGKEGIVCRFTINTNNPTPAGIVAADAIPLLARQTGFLVDSNGDGVPDQTTAFPNQLQSIVIRGNKAFLPNIAASPEGPLVFNTSTQAFLNVIKNVGTNNAADDGALNLHLGARQPEAGKKRLFFANPWAIAFRNQSGAGNAYVVSAGSDLLVKLNVNGANVVSFTVDDNTTRYIDLNDPADPDTQGPKAGKNPQGIVINDDGNRAYVANFVSRNVSIVNLNTDAVIKVVQTGARPPSGSLLEKIDVGAEMFFSSRGNFNRPGGTSVSTSERLSSEGWQNCASCHFNGWTDGVVWAFGAGPRKSVNLAGTFNPNQRSQQKVLNYSAIFDEIEDFEANIRNVSGPGGLAAAITCKNPPPATSAFDPNHGLMIGDNGDIDFAPCVINALAKRNAGRKEVTVNPVGATGAVPALTALKQWVQFAVRVPNGPLNSNELPLFGVSLSDIQEGRVLFAQQRCTTCHKGGLWSISVKNFGSPPAGNQIACEVNLAAGAPPGSFCSTAPTIGDPVATQYLRNFLRDIGSFNLGVAGKGNPIGNNIGGPEKAAATLANGVSQPAKDGLGIDYNGDGRGVGFSPQSLLGVLAVPPYYHNGACESLLCVVFDVKHRTANGTIPDVLNTAAKRAKVVKFLESIDAATTPFN